MNKYQKFVVESLIRFQMWDGKRDSMSACPVEGNKIILKQYDDITITKYSLYAVMDSIDYSKDIKVEFLSDGKWAEFPGLFKGRVPELPIDFDNQIEKVKISSASNMFDEIELELTYVFADKEAYYAKKASEDLAKKEADQKALNALIKPEHKTGNDLVNIYWDLVNDKVEVVKINLYSISNNETRLIGKYKEEEAMFKSITGLAYGKYCYEIIEFDGAGTEIARTDKIEFTLSVPNYSGRNAVTFSR